MSSTLTSALLYGDSSNVDLTKDQLGFYLNKINYNQTFPSKYKWIAENPVSVTGLNNDFVATENQGGTNTSMPTRGGSFNNVWLFNGNNKNNFYASDLAFKSTDYGSPLTVMIYFEYSTAGRGKKIFGFQNTPPWTQPTVYDRNFYVGNNNRLYYGMYDSSAKLVKTVQSTFLSPDKYYVGVATYETGINLKLFLDGVEQGTGGATIFNDDKTTVYPSVGAGYFDSTFWPETITGINYFTGGIKAMGIWLRRFTATEVQLLTNYVRAVSP